VDPDLISRDSFSKIYTMKTTYPEPIVEAVEEFIKTGIFDDYFKEENVEPEYLTEQLSHILLTKFIAGEDTSLNEEEICQAMALAGVYSGLESLKKKGLANSIEDEQGEELFFLTQEGKQELEKLKSEPDA
jgi:hypothetical protein